MKRYLINSSDGIDAMSFEDVDAPSPGPGEVKIALKAASLNYRDGIIAQGGYSRNDQSPVVPLSDGAGEIIEVGDGVSKWKIGDRVSPSFFRDWHSGSPCESVLHSGLGGGIDGVLSEQFIAPEDALVAIPEDWSYVEAATVPCAAVTAWHALFHAGDLQPGQTVLLLGTGGVSIFALQMAKAAGATVIITSSSDEKLRRAIDLGADHGINYRVHPEWHKEVRRLTSDRGVDHVVEVGGPGTLERSLKSAAVGGHVHLIGVLDSPQSKVSPMLCVFNVVDIHGIYVGSRDMHQRTIDQMVATNIRPVIDRSFAFTEAKAAYQHLASGKHFGKVVIEC
ncbi:MAG: NAD(P)-dependent alcohol dehydrogenase [Planctomycetota bacterium]